MKDTDCSWLAAMIDGEGCITITVQKRKPYSRYYRPSVVVCNTNTDLIAHCREITGVGTIGSSRPRSGCKRPWQFWVSGGKAIHILHEVYPYLIAKRRQAQILFVLNEINRRTRKQCCGHGNACSYPTQQRRESLRQAIHQLNRRGSSAEPATITLPEPRDEPSLFSTSTTE